MTAILVTMLGIAACEAYLPFWYKKIINILAAGRPDALNQLDHVIIFIALIGAASWFFRRSRDFFVTRFQSRVLSDLNNTCFDNLQQHSFSFFSNNFTGSLVRKIGRYARSFEDISDEVTYRIGQTVLQLVAILIVLAFLYWQLAAVIAVWAAIFTWVSYRFSRYKLKYDLAHSLTDSEATGHLADTITNSTNLKLFGGFLREKKEYRRLTEKLHRIRLKSWDLAAVSDAVQSAFLLVLEVGVYYFGVRLWHRGILTIGDFALIQAYLFQMLFRVWDIAKFIQKSYRNLAEADEMTDILKTPLEVQDRPDAAGLSVPKGAIEFQKVNFRYHSGVSVLKRLNFTIAPGEKVAFVGPSGGGKTTIVKLMLRFYDVQNGKILIDGQDIAATTQESLRRHIALVPQDPILFHRSLLENIRYARPNATDTDVVRAARLAHAHEFISSFPQKYQTFVGERGIKLSGGERQRVAIARAILMDAPILVFDEATSSLDSESEYLIQDALRNLMAGRTTIVVAHRLSTIMQMDRIVVIDKGRVT